MTESKWSSGGRPQQLLEWLVQNKVSLRKLRLVAVACCRRLLPSFTDERCVRAVEVAERLGDGNAEPKSVDHANAEMWRLHVELVGLDRQSHLDPSNRHFHREYAARFAMSANANDLLRSAYHAVASQTNDKRSERFAQCAIVRDIFGNPFRPVALDSRWLTSTVVDLAHTIYDEFSRQAGGYMRMPILADALMDAGCDSDDIIAHCRGDGPHVRGCWVVDLLLGKE